MDAKTYQVHRSTITLRIGDICTSRAAVLVSSDDYQLTMGGGVSLALADAAGPTMWQEARKLVPARAGDVVVTSAGKLPARYIFHAITIGPWRQEEVAPDVIVRQATHRAMQLVPLLNCRSIAFPAIGAGVARIPLKIVASQMAGVLVGALLDAADALAVEVYLFDHLGRIAPEEIFAQFESDIGKTLGLHLEQRAGNVLAPPAEPTWPRAELDAAARGQQIYEMLRHLDAQRNQAEAVLIHELSAGGSPKLLAKLRQQLDEIRELRRGYETDLDALTGPASADPNAVFLNSTWTDLAGHRQRLKELIIAHGFRFIGMEDFAAAKEPPGVYIRRKVNEAGVYLGVFGMRYGSIEPGSGLSMTELEYRQAVASRKELHIFLMDDRAPITVDMVEKDPDAFTKLLALRRHLLKAHVCELFTDVTDLTNRAERTLRDARAKLGR
jgi:O-acetyl-ADP-ribose deacetylase (regulator of RNase III)